MNVRRRIGRGLGGAAVCLLAAVPARAYIDPGSAGLPLQNLGPWLGMLVALAGGSLIFVKGLWGRLFRPPGRRWGLGLLAVALLSALIFFMLRDRMKPPTRVIVIGMDGLDHSLLKGWMASGDLPNFARIASEGSFAPLGTVVPPQSPVAWCTFATGSNPGVHGVFDFLQRTPKTYYPHLTLMKEVVDRPFWSTVPFEKVRAAPAFWELTSAKKIPTVILRHPITFPPEPVEGRMLSGLGVPDLAGGLGRYTLYVEPPFEKTPSFRGAVVSLSRDGAVWRGTVPGPKPAGGAAAPTVPLEVRTEGGRVTVRADGQDFPLDGEGWSGWARLAFKVGPLRKVQSLSRFYLASASPLRLYQTPLNFDPADPVFPISHPESYARDLASSIGPYYTLGMDEDTNALSDEVLSDDAFLAQCLDIVDQRDRMLETELKTFKDGLLVCVYDTPDRVQHMFWRTVDPRHPLHAQSAAKKDAIRSFYQRMDASLGKALAGVDANTLLLVVSDHGFASFRRAVHLNRWLADNGYLVLKDPKAAPEDFFQGVDWSKSKAYSLGLGGGIYLNLKGREPEGIVAEGDADTIAGEIITKLTGLKDPQGGDLMVSRAVRRADVFAGPLSENAPELTVMFKPGYRVSWQTALGGIPRPLVEDHKSKWSGDHSCQDPADVPGVLLSNRKFSAAAPRLSQVAPSLLKLLGADAAPGMDKETIDFQ
jgi:predicted AlkP superfamily phosphohydrolase/phosphomutase